MKHWFKTCTKSVRVHSKTKPASAENRGEFGYSAPPPARRSSAARTRPRLESPQNRHFTAITRKITVFWFCALTPWALLCHTYEINAEGLDTQVASISLERQYLSHQFSSRANLVVLAMLDSLETSRFDDVRVVNDTAFDLPRRCPAGMADMGDFCIDRYEAPNQVGAYPLVMYTLYDAEAWCGANGKRLCYDDEWTTTCVGEQNSRYPYGNEYVSGMCNDSKRWRRYESTLLRRWPRTAAAADISSIDQLFSNVRKKSERSATAAEHLQFLYQAEPAGSHLRCVNENGVYDLVGNVEEWTRRRDGGAGPQFSGKLKGRYWAESRTCRGGVTNHGNSFRFYEIGFRCCTEPI